MAARTLDIPLNSLVPIQSSGVSLPHIEFLGTLGELPPVEAVALNDELNLLVEGTHRAYRAHLLGSETIPGILAVDDEGILNLRAIALAGCDSLADVHHKYERSVEAFTSSSWCY